MEQLLHYVWKHKLFLAHSLVTTNGDNVEVIDTGLHNTNAGPDFFNAKIKIGNTLWVGNVEIHELASQWYVHAHDKDERYNNVILHVVGKADTEVFMQNGKPLVQLELKIPQHVMQHYDELIAADKQPPCSKIVARMPQLMLHSWLSALQVERLEQKTKALIQRVERCNGSWEAAFFVTLARNYGFGINGDAFEEWAYHVPIQCADHHRDNIFQIEALFMGQAGLLNETLIPAGHRQEALKDEYFKRLKDEHRYLSHKFSLEPMDGNRWLFLRLRPQNFPYIRLSQLAQLYVSRRATLSEIMQCDTLQQLRKSLSTAATPYWKEHYVFGGESKKAEKALSITSRDVLVLNTVVPTLFAYGRHRQKDEWCDRAFRLQEELKAESNHIIKRWQECGVEVQNAADSQALIQLQTRYCDRKDCLRCRIGFEYLKKNTDNKTVCEIEKRADKNS